MSHRSLFDPLMDDARLHPQFRLLRDSPQHGEARVLMDELYERMGDPNGRFISYFQAANFHSRLFELACFAYLESAGLSIDRSEDRPDFLVSDGKYDLAIEAATANPPGEQGADISILQMPWPDEKEIANKVVNEFPRRIGKVLRKKIKKRYDKLPQCAGKPFVLMVAPFFEPGAPSYTDDALMMYLYGAPPEWNVDIEPFFMRQSAACISAIAYCNSFTVPKFFRIATNISDYKEMSAFRFGWCYREHSDTEVVLKKFHHQLGKSDIPVESWSEGVTIFKNPFATNPLSGDVLPATSIISVEDGIVTRNVFGFHPVLSFTIIQV